MKVVHVITRLIVGGAQENTLITCRLLARRGHEVVLITGPAVGPEGALFEEVRKDGYEIVLLDELCREISPMKDLSAYGKLKRLLRRLNPDIVHTHSAKAGILGRWAGWALKGRLADANPARPFVVHTVHGLAFHPYQSRLLNRFYIAVEKAAARRTDAFLTVADAMTAQAKAAGIGLDKPWTTAYSAIEEEPFVNSPSEEAKAAFRRQYNLPAEAIVIVKIARLFHLKGHEYVIRSAQTLARACPNVYWLFVGDGILTEQRKEEIRRAGLEGRFRFTGLLPPSRIPLAIHASDFLVHCSLREGLARVLPQAMLCGKPVVSFDIDGAREVVNPSTGFLIEPENVQQLIYACRQLIDNPALRMQLGQNARRSVLGKFAPETMVNTIESVYQELFSELSQKRR
ncbi:MAG TPA: glycosyltransferase family 4 protein [Anaerohalosphaeraceae bacterium]|nr:glycosyltransferase family 4 protein [Anaerohalosphaeraceae bacterium]